MYSKADTKVWMVSSELIVYLSARSSSNAPNVDLVAPRVGKARSESRAGWGRGQVADRSRGQVVGGQAARG